MIMKELQKIALDNSPLCVGLDLREDHIPLEISGGNFDVRTHFVEYAKEVIDVTAALAACFKLQIACYEAYGLEGLTAYRDILNYVRKKGAIAIADVKRGDIGSTAEMYAKAHFEGDFEADIITLSPYMGEDSVSPYYPYFQKGKGAFVLGKTSNAGSRDFQDLVLQQGEKLSQRVLKSIEQWGNDCGMEDGSPIGAVVGVNNIDDIKAMKPYTDKLFLLVPGYGAQGAKIEDIRALLADEKNGVINVSRAMTAGLSENRDFRKELAIRGEKFAKELRECFRK